MGKVKDLKKLDAQGRKQYSLGMINMHEGIKTAVEFINQNKENNGQTQKESKGKESSLQLLGTTGNNQNLQSDNGGKQNDQSGNNGSGSENSRGDIVGTETDSRSPEEKRFDQLKSEVLKKLEFRFKCTKETNPKSGVKEVYAYYNAFREVFDQLPGDSWNNQQFRDFYARIMYYMHYYFAGQLTVKKSTNIKVDQLMFWIKVHTAFTNADTIIF